MEKLNYYRREPRRPRPPYGHGLLPPGRLREDALVTAAAAGWALLVLAGTVARLADGNARPATGGMSQQAAYELVRGVESERRIIDALLLAGGAACVAVAAGVAHRVRSGPRGWTGGFTALVATCATVGLLAALLAAARLFPGP